jgi:hypothetical protein
MLVATVMRTSLAGQRCRLGLGRILPRVEHPVLEPGRLEQPAQPLGG